MRHKSMTLRYLMTCITCLHALPLHPNHTEPPELEEAPESPEKCSAISSTGKHGLINKLLNESTYDKNAVPDKPVTVRIEVTIQDISEISEITNSFTTDVFFSAIWQDTRLEYTKLDPCKELLSLDSDIIKRLWTPNICFSNSKDVKVHVSPEPNVLLLIFPNGTVWINYRVRAIGPCDMDLTFFPFGEFEPVF